MYKHILFPTDGSAISTCAAKLAMNFAREIGAIVTGIYVCPEYHLFDYPGQNTEHALERYSHESSAHTIKLLAQVELMASEIGVKCDTVSAVSDYPYLEIIKAAEEKKCDLIAMASHGKKGIKGILLGSEANKILTHSRIPVLIFR